MYLHGISAQGNYTCIALADLNVWRLELGVKAIVPPLTKARPSDETHIALLLGYPNGEHPQRIIIAAVNSRSADNAPAIAAAGFQNADLDSNRARLHDAAKVLCNVDELKKEADDIAVGIAALADLYHAILDALVAPEVQDTGLSSTAGPPLKGELAGWRFAITRKRFDPWRDAPATFKPKALQLLAAVAPSVTAPAPSPGTGAPLAQVPAPGTPRPGAVRRPTREQARRQGAAPEAPTAPTAPAAGDADLPDEGDAPDPQV
jgi:hypothetical protein